MYKCTHKRYRYKYRSFEIGKKGAEPLNKTGSKRKSVSDAFYEIYLEWCGLPNREDYRIS